MEVQRTLEALAAEKAVLQAQVRDLDSPPPPHSHLFPLASAAGKCVPLRQSFQGRQSVSSLGV